VSPISTTSAAANPSDVDAMNAQVWDLLRLDAVRTCPHDDDDNCDCRKPNPGLLLRAADEFGLELGASFMVGDRWRDVEAGKRAGCRTVFIDYDYAEQQPLGPDYTTRSVLKAAYWIVSHTNQF
jgi:D-glycero-D-manno-heptose 1,7-bisphosphate phosphatase